jgi:molybdopterin molybdotransferase
MLAYTEALAKVLDATRPLPPIKQSLQEIHTGQILAETVYARLELPPADTAAMDGFAFMYSSQNTDTPLKIVGFVPAGEKLNRPIGANETVRIMTGAPLPKGCDTVVPLEETEQTDNWLRLKSVPNSGFYVRLRGEDFHLNDQIIAAGTTLTPGAIGLLAAAGISRPKVYPLPRVAILSTGDELISLKEPPQDGKIINSNAHMLAARLQEEGIKPVMLGIARDCPDDLEEKLRVGLTADLLITTGGVSVGDRDLVKSALNNLDFNKVFWKVAISPGKPILFGTIGTLPVFGLPGNPTATATTFELFIRPALRRLAGFNSPLAPRIKVRLADSLGGGRKLQQYLWGQLTIVDGALQFHPAKRRKSGQLYDLLHAHALLPLASDSPELLVGSEVEVILLRMPDSSDS